MGIAARFWLAAAGFSGAGGVALAAAAAHGGLADPSLAERAGSAVQSGRSRAEKDAR